MAEFVLKDGSTTSDKRLDRLVFFDERSRNFRAVVKTERPKLRSNSHNFRKFKAWLDQKSEGACVGFGIGHDVMAYPRELAMYNELCRSLYFEAQKRDPWEGGAYPGASPFYEGTSVLAGLQVYKEYLELATNKPWEYRWCFSGNDVVTALVRTGVIIGVPWYEGMFDTDSKGFIHVTGHVAGGHCTYLNAQKIVWRKNVTHYTHADIERELTPLRLRNSWGQGWGVDGDAFLSLADLDKLLSNNGEAAILVPKGY